MFKCALHDTYILYTYLECLSINIYQVKANKTTVKAITHYYLTRIKRCVIKPTCENFSSFHYFFYEKTVEMHSIFLYSF